MKIEDCDPGDGIVPAFSDNARIKFTRHNFNEERETDQDYGGFVAWFIILPVCVIASLFRKIFR
jgi:hypothetical protein